MSDHDRYKGLVGTDFAILGAMIDEELGSQSWATQFPALINVDFQQGTFIYRRKSTVVRSTG